MIPFRDHNPSDKFPIVTVILIATNVLVFLFQLSLQASGQLEPFIMEWAVVPADITNNPNTQELLTLISAMFMHGGFAHIGGNMLYLWIFGDNVEARLGSVLYLVFYLLCGLAASFAQIAIDPNSTIPNLGASGAIAGVLGAYLITFPRARVDTYVPRRGTVAVSAIIVLGFWFILQLFNGVASIATVGGAETGGGVAYWAHAGGFVAGMILMAISSMAMGKPLPATTPART